MAEAEGAIEAQAGAAAQAVNLGIVDYKLFKDGPWWVWAVRLDNGFTVAVTNDGTPVGCSMVPGDELISHAFMYQQAVAQGRGSW